MTPYTGPESPLGVFLVLGIVASIILLGCCFTMDKKENAAEEAEPGSGHALRRWKHILALITILTSVSSVAWAMSIDTVGKELHHEKVVAEIESHGVDIIQGFEDPSIALRPDSFAKFMVESDSGLVRCRANASGEDKPLEYLCQSNNGEFLTPLADL